MPTLDQSLPRKGGGVRKLAQGSETSAETFRPDPAILVSQGQGGISLERHEIFAKNLETIREINGQSIEEFAEEIGLPKSTLQSIRLSGNTTLDTAMRIADGLGLSLDSLTGDSRVPEQIDLVRHLLKSIAWMRELSAGEQETVAEHFHKILEVVCK